MIAPMVNIANEATAATHADPPSSCGSNPSSSRAIASSAAISLLITRLARRPASSAVRPLRW